MTSSNRTQVASVLETTPGTPPGSPRFRKLRLTGEALTQAWTYVDSDEIRDDRMMGDPIKVMQAAAGSTNHELSYIVDMSAFSDHVECAMYNSWLNTPVRDNDGTPDSNITGIVASTGVITVVTGDAFLAGHLVKLSGFTAAGNNGIFKLTTGSATVPAVGTGILTDEAAPPGTARMKVVGFEGASADIVAAADGLTATALDFTTLGLHIGQFIKIGGTADGTQFATLVTAGADARANAWARVIGIAAGKLTLDCLPDDWGVDTGTGKTIRLWWGDFIKNGVTEKSLTVQKGYLGQGINLKYFHFFGMHVGTWDLNFQSGDKITGSFNYTGMGGNYVDTPLDATPDEPGVEQVMAGNADVGRLYEAGAGISAPNWAQSMTLSLNNNLRTNEAVGSTSPVAVREGECTVTGAINTYFGSGTLLEKFNTNAPTSLATRVGKNNQAIIFQVPRAIYRGGGNPSAGAKNQDVMLNLEFQASKDPLTSAHLIIDRVEYYQK